MGRRDELMHYGIKGMKWGIRRQQNRSGTSTSSGEKRTSSSNKNRLTDKQKKAIKIGAAFTATFLAAYGAYRLNRFINDKKLVKDAYGDLINEYLKDKTDVSSLSWNDLQKRNINLTKLSNDRDSLYNRYTSARKQVNEYQGTRGFSFGKSPIQRARDNYRYKEGERRKALLRKNYKEMGEKIQSYFNQYITTEPIDEMLKRSKIRNNK